jgi:energy-coupling factor transporter ATP-binding protein EcfA2
MSLLSTPPNQPGEAPSPSSRRSDGIALDRRYLPRAEIIQDVYEKAKEHNFVVLSAPPSSGKTSLLQLLEDRLRKEKNTITAIALSVRTLTVEELLRQFSERGINSDGEARRKLQNTWLLIDDAQNAHDETFHRFWEMIAEDSGLYHSRGLYVIISATFHLMTSKSPVSFRSHIHADPSLPYSEAEELLNMHLSHWGNEYDAWICLKDQLFGTFQARQPRKQVSHWCPHGGNPGIGRDTPRKRIQRGESD